MEPADSDGSWAPPEAADGRIEVHVAAVVGAGRTDIWRNAAWRGTRPLAPEEESTAGRFLH